MAVSMDRRVRKNAYLLFNNVNYSPTSLEEIDSLRLRKSLI